MDAPAPIEPLLNAAQLDRRRVWRERITSFMYQWFILFLSVETIVIVISFIFGLSFAQFLIPTAILGLSVAIVVLIAWGIIAAIQRFYPSFKNPHRFGYFREDVAPPQEKIRQFVRERAQLNAKDICTFERLMVMREIDERVDRLRNRTAFILATIALALIAAAVVVLFAGRLTSIDAEAVSNIDRGKSELSDATRNLARLYRYQSLYQQLDSLTKLSELNQSSDLEKRIAEKKKEIDALTGYREAGSTPSDARSAASMIDIQERLIISLRDLVDQAMKKELLADHGYGDWRYIVATAITRVGVVLIIVFLVQILMGLYRYNTKLIAYYNSRRDLFTLWDGKTGSLTSLSRVLAPPQIDFGKEPKHPLEDIIRAANSRFEHGFTSARHLTKSKQNSTEERANG